MALGSAIGGILPIPPYFRASLSPELSILKGQKIKNAAVNELPQYPKSKINIKNILINSFKFLIFEWKLFAIVLAFHIFKHFIFDQNSCTNNDFTPTQQYFEFVLMQLPRIIFDLLFWVSIIPIIILAAEEYLTKQQRVSFKWKKMTMRYFAPVIIVLENKTFIEGTKRSVDNIRNKFIVSLAFILVLDFLNPSNIFMFLLISQYAAIPGFDHIQLIQTPGFRFFQLILSSGWFIIYNAAVVGFYLGISEERKH